MQLAECVARKLWAITNNVATSVPLNGSFGEGISVLLSVLIYLLFEPL